LYFGSHVSIRKGYLEAAKACMRIGGRSFQYFPKNPRSLSTKSFDRRDAEACAVWCRQHDLLSIAHSAYPANLAAEGEEKQVAVIRSLLNDLEITEACGSVGLVVHFGIYKGAEPLQGYIRIVQTLNEVLRLWEGQTLILLENQSGEHARMGMTMEELTQVRSLSAAPHKIGFCLDTCHLFASGLWDGHNWKEVVSKGTQTGYWEHLRAIHLNDSVYPTRSYKDRHANIGRGEIGSAALKQVLASPFLQSMPIVLETPSSEQWSHVNELQLLQEWMGNSK
jgi:deoxyribonuclease-4